ncbi:HD domain-containing protein [Paraherbaspirillum soli]|uniref:HD domain-containing protein n=1 Tax=Paraherbaspirillum soli TaxID=631222 RepID=A0ABW0MEV7_9BURK
MTLSVNDISQLFNRAGGELYGGEAITQREHALQAGWLAEQSGADEQLIIACLLHDLGHMLFGQGDDDLAQGRDDLHQVKIIPFLRGLLPPEIIEPIALHVDAKRYLCHVEPAYFAALSDASRTSLALQGGAMDAAAAQQFAARPHAACAIALRRCDDAAKVVGMTVPPYEYFLPRLLAIAETAGAQ